ncbi:hypothetical protein [Amycolatopsis anabasis]|uniref:hypothetical protein n=1 Tax=Amycolatopsis anabasis TaxID=1840409 RepID=UPI00131BBA90|nr:hypothetical protein [Amycolatopsis anabasis]
MNRSPSVALVVLAVLATGCGAAAEPDARATANRFVTAVGVADQSTACGLLAERAARMLTEQSGQSCTRALARLGLPHEPVRELASWGGEARARSAADTLFLHEFPQGWRITGAGCRSLGENRPYACAVGGG